MLTNITGTTDAEAAALAATAAAIAAGEDPFGDEDQDTEGEASTEAAGADTTGDEAPPADEAGEEEGEGSEALSQEALEAVAEATAAEAAAELATAPPRYKAGDQEEAKAKRTEQLAIKAKALKDLMDGVIEPEEYSRIEGEVTDVLESLAVSRTLHEANVQGEQQTQEAIIDKIIAAAKTSGEVDYIADTKAAKQFDTAMAMLAQDGEKRTFAELAADAHKAVLAIRGVTAAPAAAPAPEPAKPRENGKGPMTLRDIPAAETPTSGGGWKEQLATLSGQAYEEAFSRLSPGQKAELLND